MSQARRIEVIREAKISFDAIYGLRVYDDSGDLKTQIPLNRKHLMMFLRVAVDGLRELDAKEGEQQ